MARERRGLVGEPGPLVVHAGEADRLSLPWSPHPQFRGTHEPCLCRSHHALTDFWLRSSVRCVSGLALFRRVYFLHTLSWKWGPPPGQCYCAKRDRTKLCITKPSLREPATRWACQHYTDSPPLFFCLGSPTPRNVPSHSLWMPCTALTPSLTHLLLWPLSTMAPTVPLS